MLEPTPPSSGGGRPGPFSVTDLQAHLMAVRVVLACRWVS